MKLSILSSTVILILSTTAITGARAPHHHHLEAHRSQYQRHDEEMHQHGEDHGHHLRGHLEEGHTDNKIPVAEESISATETHSVQAKQTNSKGLLRPANRAELMANRDHPNLRRLSSSNAESRSRETSTSRSAGHRRHFFNNGTEDHHRPHAASSSEPISSSFSSHASKSQPSTVQAVQDGMAAAISVDITSSVETTTSSFDRIEIGEVEAADAAEKEQATA